MDGFDLLGATDAFADQYITLRIKSIDRDRLQQKLGGTTGSLASTALAMADAAPKGALDLVVPLVRNKAKDYGVDTEIVVSNAPPTKKGRAMSEFWPGLLVGTAVGAGSLLIYKGVQRLLRR